MFRKNKARFLAIACAAGIALSQAAGAAALNAKDARTENPAIQNIIVMIPDGMSMDGVTLARWYKAFDEKSGSVDTNVNLALDEMASGLVRTYWKNNDGVGPVTDSAPGGTTFATGHKTNDKFVGVTADSVPIASIVEAANQIGKATGIVATSNIQHATPAAFSSHYNDRSKYDIIGEQQAYNGMDVVLGGGSEYLQEPYRKDEENIVAQIKSMGYRYVTSSAQMKAVTSGKLWGMFAQDAMAYDMDRKTTAASEPTLAEMTRKAIELLSKDKDGFFLMVEGSKVDWAAHANDPIGLVSDILAFDSAVKVALDYAKANQNTMVLATTDHGNGGITIGDVETGSSYSSDPLAKFIAPIKKAKLTGEGIEAKLNAQRTNIAKVMNDFYGIADLSAEEEAAIQAAESGSMNSVVGPMISKRAHLGWTTPGHTGEDVNLFSYLPGDKRITGLLENTDIAQICAGVWGISLDETTKKLYVEAETAFKAKGAIVAVDTQVQAGGVMKVTKGSQTLMINENKNHVLLDGKQVNFNSVIVNQGGKFYVPQSVIALID